MRWRRVALKIYKKRETVKTTAVRAGSFFFGYKILHHEIYGADHAEPILVFLGLWLCGVAPATFFDQLRKMGVSLQSELDKEIEDADADTGMTRRKSDAKEKEDDARVD